VLAHLSASQPVSQLLLPASPTSNQQQQQREVLGELLGLGCEGNSVLKAAACHLQQHAKRQQSEAVC
jgi:hypothetical protein